MYISPIKSFTSIKNYRNFRFNNRYTKPYRSVSFLGQNDTIQHNYPNNIQNGIEIGKKVLELMKSNSLNVETLSKTLNENSPIPIEIINYLPKETIGDNEIIANTIVEIDDFNKPVMAHIFISDPPKTPEKESYYAATVAHEYTHALQGAKNEDCQGILNYTNDPDEIMLIAITAQTTLNDMIESCFQKFPEDKEERKNIRNLILNNKFDIEKYMGKIDFDEILSYNSFWRAGELNKPTDEIMNVVKNWIIRETKKEIEAYIVTLDILERSNYDPKTKVNWLLNKEIYSFINKSLKAL